MGVSLIGFCAHIKNKKKLNKNSNDLTNKHVQFESKKTPYGFLKFFPNGWEFVINFYTPIIR